MDQTTIGKGRSVKLRTVKMRTLARHTCIGGLAAIAGGALLSGVLPASAQEASSVSEFERPYGFGYGQESAPYSAIDQAINNHPIAEAIA